MSKQDPTPDCRPGRGADDAMDAETAIALAATFKALSDPVRLRLLGSVAGHPDDEACVCDISAGVGVSQPTISHHLKVLRDAGLLTSQRRGTWVYYAVAPAALESATAALAALSRAGVRA